MNWPSTRGKSRRKRRKSKFENRNSVREEPPEGGLRLFERPFPRPCRPALLVVQTSGEVRDHGDGLADLLGSLVHEESLAVRSDTIENVGGGPGGDERLSRAELEGGADGFHWDRQHVKTRVEIVELLAVRAPHRSLSPFDGDLPLALGAAVSHHEDFCTAGLRGHVGEPMPIGRKRRLRTAVEHLSRFAVALER